MGSGGGSVNGAEQCSARVRKTMVTVEMLPVPTTQASAWMGSREAVFLTALSPHPEAVPHGQRPSYLIK